MDVLVVGGTRFVGYALARRLVSAGHRVSLLNRGTVPDPFGGRVERLRGDRTTDDFRRLVAGRRFDAVVDFAAYRGEEVRSAVEALGSGAGHYVFVSSGQVYLVREGCPAPAREEDYAGPLKPRPPEGPDRREWDYGAGKRECEDVLAEAWDARGFPSTRLRLPMVDGERDPSRRLEAYLWRLLDAGPVIVPDGGSHPVRHVYAAEVALAVAGMLGDPATFGKAYNLAQNETPSLAELLGQMAEILGTPARLVPLSRARLEEAGLEVRSVSPFSGSWMSFLDPSRAVAELGFRHQPLRAYLEKILGCFLAHPPAEPPPGYARREVERALAARA
jgi:nucleoside-diphosphate-sugar epimerase